MHVVCLATSVDGIAWTRPPLRLHATDRPGLADNNIVIPGEHHHGMDHFEAILKDPMDADARKRCQSAWALTSFSHRPAYFVWWIQ